MAEILREILCQQQSEMRIQVKFCVYYIAKSFTIFSLAWRRKKSAKYAFPIRIGIKTLHSMNLSVVMMTLNDTQKSCGKMPFASWFFCRHRMKHTQFFYEIFDAVFIIARNLFLARARGPVYITIWREAEINSWLIRLFVTIANFCLSQRDVM